MLQQVSGFSASGVSWVMLVYGVSVAAGNIWGGRLADRKGPVRALQIVFGLLAAVLFILTFTKVLRGRPQHSCRGWIARKPQVSIAVDIMPTAV